ncbi:hypothetical protein Tco_0818168 [Tanacetum coccineum]
MDSLVQTVWSIGASLRASKEGPPAILATIDRTPYTITESLVRSQLQLDDEGGVKDFTKSGSWDQFGSQLAIAIICLTEGRRFLQMILEIEPRSTKQYHAFKLTSKMFANMRLNFQGDHMPLLATMLPPPQAAIAGESSGEDAPSHPQTGPSSDPNIASSLGPHESALDLFTSTNVEYDTMGGSFQTSPPRSTQVPPEVNSQESDLQAHKLLFKEVVGKLIKRVKLLEDKLKGRKRKVVLTDSDKEDGAELITTPESPSSPVRDARKGKGIAIDKPSPTQHKTFKQLEEERLGWEAAERLQAQELADFEKQRVESLMKDANLARQMSQDFDMTEAQRKRQQEVLASAANYSDAAWDIILARLQENPDLTSSIFGVEFNDDDFATRMVELVNTQRKELAKQQAQERRDRPMTPSQLRQYMRTYVKNQGPAIYSTGWTMAQVRKLTPEQLQEEFDKIQRAVAFIRGFKRDGSPKTRASSKKLKTGGDDVNLAATSHEVPQEEAGATPSPNVSQEEVAAPSHSQDIPDAPVKAPSTTTSTAQHIGSSPKKVGTRKKRLGRKGVHPSHSTIPIEDGDPEAEHKMCIKYASDALAIFALVLRGWF